MKYEAVEPRAAVLGWEAETSTPSAAVYHEMHRKTLETPCYFGHNKEEGGDFVDIKEYFDITRDMDARAEARFQNLEERLAKDRRDSEARHEQRIRDLDERLMADRRESEARHEQHMRAIQEDRRELVESINRLEDRMSGEMSELRGEFRETKRWIIGLTIGTVASMLALAAGTIFGILSLVE